MKIIIALNTSWNFVNFRSGLITALLNRGYEVVAVAPYDSYAPRLEGLGCRYLPLPMDNKGTDPRRDTLLVLRFFFLFLREKPDVYLGYTVKPNIYGSFAAHLLGIPVINNIAGLGAVFIEKSWVTRVVRALYKLALSPSRKVFFQNNDDRQLFIDGGLAKPAVAAILPGSGIDLSTFTFSPVIARHKKFRFLLIARMLWDKGVGEFVEAARQLQKCYPNIECCLVGFVDVQNPAAISRAQMNEWVAEGHVHYFGVSDDVRHEIGDADCIVLPSYREGTPRTLLEGAAIGRPLVTTDTVGCREVVDDGKNGYLCRVRDAADLAKKMEQVLLLTDEDRYAMALYGRRKMEGEFDEKIVINCYLEAIENLGKDT